MRKKRKIQKYAVPVAAVTAAGTITALAVKRFIQYRTQDSDPLKLGFNWHFINHNTGVWDCARQFKNELKWGLQRFRYGYDDSMFFDFDHHLFSLIVVDLRRMIKNRHGSPVLKGWTDDNCHEKFTEVLKKMLYHFEQAQDRDNANNAGHHDKALEMLKEYGAYLWD